MAENFASLPIIDYNDALSPTTKAQFLSELRHALVKVGFFYLKNHTIPSQVQQDLLQTSGTFFGLPADKKAEVNMANSKSFRGYTGLRHERTAAKADERETFFWPTETLAPGFRQSVERYLTEVDRLSERFTGLVAEALDMDPSVFAKFFKKPCMSGVKIAAYPLPNAQQGTTTEFQGVGPHKDGSFLTYLLQGTEHSSLEVQNKSGEWIAAPPIPGTLVVNIGRSLEALTQGVCVATTHRVNLRDEQYSRPSGNGRLGTRLTFPFFQMLGFDVTQEDIQLDIPAHITSLCDQNVQSDAESFFEEIFKTSIGEAFMVNALTSHPEVGKRWYPEPLAEALRQQQEGKDLDDSKMHATARVS
ncbi:unnamed protein product [Penicillium nalgiovense]|uniref:Fe2OG dioxygenase domain-containing protein n=1 Tax=Penicillium nalgiovense TaxID=60175 RepID=A0A9W4MRN7_PENNA|nr:unnamed protein product [Penicillium nalgiovense]CAG8010055.1 unnamed protein product [Penicillium nalgiovense]CAG8033592.1 unnamed protein product [Penicillium nalgiovense]CAG8064540.1 unnamed protein product [Penicillium nalgiovense]CAG8073176.1 unnamed protein product [Penicillium nalgiovense]